MTELAQYLESMEPDMMNVTRLFGIADAAWEDPRRFSWSAWEEGGSYHCRVSGDGREAEGSAAIPMDGDAQLRALHRKRAARRLCRQTLYNLCREVTGIHPPWGSLTDAGLTEDEAVARLSSTFDVTEEKALLLRDVARAQRRLPKPDNGQIDVYVGIPFCTTRCAYCSFSSGELGRGKLVEPYLQALFHEMEEGARLLRQAGKKLRAVYVGGGTPTALNEDQLTRLLERLMTLYPGAGEYTVEAGRPDTITPGKLRAIREAGVGRISINPQTMNDRTLQVIGRAHTAQQVEEAYAMARTEGMGHINMDVIAGLPGEHPEDFARTMEAAVRLHPESLTVHTLAIKRSSRMHLENAPLPDGNEAAAMVRMGLETAQQMGLAPYYLYRQKHMAGNQENVGYALPGHACLYNVDIMEETTHILALGAGGISKRIYPGEGQIGRAPNVSNIELYIARVEEMIGRKRALFLEAR